MASTAIATVVKMMQSLPEPAQEQAVEHFRVYLEELREEAEWDALVERTRPHLISAAKGARQEIADGLAEPMEYDRL